MDILTITIADNGLVYIEGIDEEMEYPNVLTLRLDPIEVEVRDYRKKKRWWRR